MEAWDPSCKGRGTSLYAKERGLSLWASGQHGASPTQRPPQSASAILEPFHPPDPYKIHKRHLLDAGPL